MSDNQWYDSAANLLADDQKATIKNNLQYSLDANTQKEAGVRKLYNATGIPIDSIRDNEDAVRTNNTVQQFDADGLVHKAPITAQLLTDINNTKLLHDDIPATTAVESAAGAPQLTPKQAAARGMMNFTKDVDNFTDELGHGAAEWMHKAAKAVNLALGSLAVAGDKINGDTRASDWWFNKMVDPAEAGVERNALKPDAAFGGKLAHSVGALPPMLASIYLTGGTAQAPAIGAAVPGALATLGNAVQHAVRSMWFPATTDAVNTGQKVFEATGDGRQALLAASAQYTATTGMGVLPLSIMGGLAKRVATGGVAQMVVGENSRMLMNAASPESMQTPFNWEDTLVSGTVGSLFAATMGPRAASSGHEAVRQTYIDATRADAAADDFNRLSAVSQMSSASAMRERDPTMFKKFVEDVAATKDVPDLYVDVRELDKAFAQSGVTGADLSATMPDVIKQMDQARESNGLVKIPMADYATHIAGTEIDKQILHSVKTDPEGMTYKDAIEYQNAQEQQMREAVAKTLVTKLNDVGFEASKFAVHEDVKQQLADTGYVRPEVAEAYAALHSTFFANMGKQMGVNASEAYHTLGGAKIVAEDLASGFKQGDPRSESDFYKSMGIESGATPKQVEQYQSEHGWTHSENDQATGLPTWKNDKVSLTAPRDVSGGFDVFYKAEDGHQAVKYDIKNNKGEKVGYTVLEMNGGFPKRLLDIVIDKDKQGARHGENTVAAITADAGELGIWNIVPGAKSWWDRIGTKTVDEYDGSINFKDYSDARASRENTGGLGDNVTQGGSDVEHARTASESKKITVERYDALTTGRASNDGRKPASGDRRLQGEDQGQDLGRPGTGTGSAGTLLNQGNRGAYDPATRTLALLKNADLSTFLHESGHFFLDTYERMAAMDGAPPKVKEDFQKLLDWFGVRDGDEWHSLGLDGQRESHEKFARGFEAYLMEGKAPNVELAGLFARFRSWLLNVYKSLGALNVDLTPEVKGVMDRMLASEDSIKEAEAVRGYDPLFKSAEAAGMTPEVWAEYQSLGSEATNAAIADMQSRGIRDMKWLSNAKSGAIKDLQQKAKTARAEVRMKASKEIRTEPVYQAWQYLTDREGGKGRQIDPLEKRDSKNVDNRRDSMFQAIAKLGGIRGESVGPEWGLKPADYPMADNAGGKRTVVQAKAGKGMSLDEMGAHLAAEGYLKTDEYGRYDSHEFEEKFHNELGGSSEFSHAADYDYLRNGPKKITLSEAQERTGGRIDLDSIRRIDPQAAAKLESYRMTRNEGLPPDIVAEMFGFADGHELIKAIADAEHPNTAIEGLTDRLMLEKHGELSSPKAIERAAEVAIHNEARAKFVATELVALKNATTVRGETGKTHEIETKNGGIVKVRQTVDIVAKAAKMVADSQIAGKTINELRPGLYAAAEATAAKNADKALKAGDIQAAAVEKRAQLLNNRLARAAVDAQTEVNKGVDYLKKFDKASVRENINIDYRDQIDVLLDRYDLRKSQNGTDLHRKQSLMNWVEAQAEQGLEPNIPEKLLDALDRRHYKEMTVEEFRGLLEGIKSIEHLGRLKDKLRDRAEMRSIQDLADEANTVMGELPQRTPESNRGLSRMEKTWQGAKSSGRSAMAALLKMEQMMDWLDARNPNGVFNRIVFKRIADAGTHENDMRTRVKKQIDALMKTNLVDVTKDKGQKYVAKGLIDGLTGKAQEFTKKEMLMLAGNMGNDSNASKLIAGEKWNESAVWDFLHANMGKADWDFVAGMGKTLESLWPEQLAMNRRLGNTNPEKIEPRPFATPHGDYEGWYWPMIYDPARAVDVAERGAKKADALFENSYTKANTDTGRMNTRNANYARPLLLDLDALPRVILDNIHDLAFREAVIDADKFLSHKDVREGIVNALSQEHYDQLRPWLQSIANDGRVSDDGMRAMKWFNDVAHGARTRATIVGLGYRVSTMLVHGSSAAMESIAEMGPKWFGVGLNQFKNPLDWTANRDFIFERSGEMRNRMNEVDRDVREHLREIDLHMMDPTTKAVSRATDAMKAHAYQGIAMLDMASALPTWMGAYLKGLEVPEKGGLGLGEQEAIYLADKTVRNAHGGTGVKDLAAVQRGPEFFKLFSMFYTFWNHNVNRIMDTTRMATELPATYRSGDMAKFKGDLGSVMMRTLIYVFGVQIMHHMINPPKEDATEESWGVWAAKEIGLAATAGVPILRDLAAHYISGKDYSVTPAAGIVDTIGRSGQDIWNASTGANPVSDKWLKHSIATSGYLFGLPLGQASSSVQFLYDVNTGQQRPEETMDWWRGMIHGDMHKK